jgi:RNA polymerase primary sigma factor
MNIKKDKKSSQTEKSDAILVKEWKETKDKKTLEKIIINHYAIIYSIINYYSKLGFSKEDLFAEGVLGILTAIDKYDVTKNVKFSTYAYFWIKAKVLKFIKNIRPFINHQGLKDDQNSDDNDYNAEHSHFEDIDDVFNHSIKKSRIRVTNLDEEDTELQWAHFSNVKNQLEETCIEDNFAEILKISMLSLSRKEQFILERRWLSDKHYTFEEISKDVGLSSERVRQIEKEVFRKIRDNLTEKFGTLRGELAFGQLFITSYKKQK